MQKTLIGVLILAISVVYVSFAWAGGDKVRGENGEGEVNQVSFDNQGRQN